MMRTGIRNIDQYHSFYPRKEKPNHTSYNLGFLFMNSTNFLPSNPKSLQDAAICPRIYKAGQTMLTYTHINQYPPEMKCQIMIITVLVLPNSLSNTKSMLHALGSVSDTKSLTHHRTYQRRGLTNILHVNN